MHIKIYQINSNRDSDNRIFRRYDETKGVDFSIYDNVFIGQVNAEDLEDVYYIFNALIPECYCGRSLSVSDLVEVLKDSDNLAKGVYYVDEIGFKKVSENNLKNLLTSD